MPGTPNPFQQQAEDIGTYLAEARARDAKQKVRVESQEGPSENTD